MLKKPARAIVALSALLACGPPPRAEAPATEPAAEETSAASAAADGELEAAAPRGEGSGSEGNGEAPPASGDDGLDADIAALSASTQSGSSPAASTPAGAAGSPARAAPGTVAADQNVGRDIVYRVTPKGLVIEVDGIHFRPEAKVVREKSGSYSIRLVLNAESFDGRRYWVDKGSKGPLSIAGKVEERGGKSSRFDDQRGETSEEGVMSEAPRRFEQRWPGQGQRKVWAGQTVTLEVGLWGVRAESERERPVRRLFVVKMVAGDKAPAVITPPAMDWGG
jgi:hypothetical protein